VDLSFASVKRGSSIGKTSRIHWLDFNNAKKSALAEKRSKDGNLVLLCLTRLEFYIASWKIV